MFSLYLRTMGLYIVLIVVIRLMGKRQIGQMEPSEFVVTMLVANLATIPMENPGSSVYSGILPLLTVLGMEWLFSGLNMKSIFLRRLLCGKPVILIENGHILQKNLRRTGVTLDELTGHLREKDVLDLREVQFAILETNGNLSVFPFPDHRPPTASEAQITPQAQAIPITLISDGKLLSKNLALAGKDRLWVERYLRKKRSCIGSTFLLTLDANGNTLWLKKEEMP